MSMISMEAFEQAGLDAMELDITAKIKAFNANFVSWLTAENGFFGKIDDLAGTVKKQTGWSGEIADAIRSPEEFKVLKDAGLKEYDIGGKKYLFKTEIDWNQLDDKGRTNAERIKIGRNPIAPNGDTIEYHHIGQGKNAPLAEVTISEHDKIPVDNKKPSEVRPDGNNNEWNKQKRQLLKARDDAAQTSKFTLTVRAGHETGIESGRMAAGITAAISTVDNFRGFMSGEITAQEAFADVAKDTGAAAAMGYGTGFITSTVASATRGSSHALIRTLGNANVASAAISFGIDSYDSVVNYAQGEISGTQFAYDLGESASGVAGAMSGASVGASLGSVVPVVGTVVGGLVGGMVGYAVSTGAYATVIEAVTNGTDVPAEKAETLKDKTVEMGQSVIDTVATAAPEALGAITEAMNDFAASLNLPIHF